MRSTYYLGALALVSLCVGYFYQLIAGLISFVLAVGGLVFLDQVEAREKRGKLDQGEKDMLVAVTREFEEMSKRVHALETAVNLKRAMGER